MRPGRVVVRITQGIRLALACSALVLAACGGGGGGGGSSPISAAPAGLSLTPSSRTLHVSWNALPGASAYHVYLAASPNVTPATYDELPEGQHAPGVHALNVRFEGLAEGGTYWVIVAGEGEAGEGPASTPVA